MVDVSDPFLGFLRARLEADVVFEDLGEDAEDCELFCGSFRFVWCEGKAAVFEDEFDALLPTDGIGQPEGAMPVLAKAGQVLLFDRRLRHAATPNWSAATRKAYFIGYA